MPAPDSIRDLVQRFQSQLAGYHKASYNETELRRDFLDPFFAALGWDMTNTGGGSEKYRDVIHEVSVEVEGQAKAADYAFRMGGNNVFFVEAKKPAVNIAASAEAAFQLRSYGWSGKLPLSLLTDFEQLAVYDCRDKPKHGESANLGRVSLYHYTEYIDKWDEIYSRFSREAVFTGKFDQFAGGTKGKKGTTDVDDDFLEMLEGWRELLARNIALRNPGLSVRELNFAVQTTIDRIIFLRICEDRGIEADDALRSATDGKDIYQDLLVLFKTADRKYNSGLFHFSAEKGEPSPADTLTPGLKIDDKVLKDILAHLYHPSPYAFKYIPADILGQVYERFLGKVIRLTAGHQAKVEEKPEVRKAGGVYYTPTYIVAYIVKNTLGELLQGETPETQAVRPLRVLDPACGSGSFLLGAYQYLLDWYLDWYAAHEPARWTRGKNPAVVESQAGWQLTMERKKEILLAHIFGVDIDSQAVEVTKLSLLLKVVENPGQLSLLEERILPDLGENVKCGNSLIGMDYYNGRQMPMFGDEELYRVNPFDWQDAFKKVFAQGGFDAVIGNPPYLYSAGQLDIDYYQKKYTLSQYQTDFYVYFIERGINLTKKDGKFSFIVSDSWLNSEYFSKVRNNLLSKHRIEKIAIFDYPVFDQAALENSIFVITVAQIPSEFFIERFKSPESSSIVNVINPNDILQYGLINPQWNKEKAQLIEKMEKDGTPLENIVKINRGIHAYRTDGYGKSKFSPGPQTNRDYAEKSYHANMPLNETYLPELKGKNVFRFSSKPTGIFLSYGNWLAEPRTPEFFVNPKIVLRKIIGEKLLGTFIEEPTALDQSLYIAISETNDINQLLFVLGILLSKSTAWFIRTKYSIYDTLYPWYTKKQLAAFPIPKYDNQLVNLINSMLTLHKQLAAARSPQEKDLLQRQIAYTDREIDALVYELYGLTDEEIRIVEGAE